LDAGDIDPKLAPDMYIAITNAVDDTNLDMEISPLA